MSFITMKINFENIRKVVNAAEGLTEAGNTEDANRIMLDLAQKLEKDLSK